MVVVMVRSSGMVEWGMIWLVMEVAGWIGRGMIWMMKNAVVKSTKMEIKSLDVQDHLETEVETEVETKTSA